MARIIKIWCKYSAKNKQDENIELTAETLIDDGEMKWLEKCTLKVNLIGYIDVYFKVGGYKFKLGKEKVDWLLDNNSWEII